jgi:hypothetical protein
VGCGSGKDVDVLADLWGRTMFSTLGRVDVSLFHIIFFCQKEEVSKRF